MSPPVLVPWILSPPLASHLAIPVHSSQEPFAGENMAYVNPAHQAVLDEMGRIEEAAAGRVSVLEILSPGSSSRNIKDVKKGYLRQAQRLHPHRGGNFSKVRGPRALLGSSPVRGSRSSVQRSTTRSTKRARSGLQLPTLISLCPGSFGFRGRRRRKKPNCSKRS